MDATGALRLRHLQPSDNARVLAVIDEWWDGRPMSARLSHVFFSHFAPTSFVIETDTELVGFLLGFLSQTREDEAYVRFAGVHPNFRRLGLGRRLYERLNDVDLEAGRLAVRRALIPSGREVIVSEPKTIKGRRVTALDPGTVEVLKSQAARRLDVQDKWDEAWIETGLVFIQENGEALDPESISRYFRQAVKKSLLPQIRLHDLRHTHATLALQTGIHPKIVSERLGHATISITLDTYSHAVPAMQEEAAALIAGLVFAEPGG